MEVSSQADSGPGARQEFATPLEFCLYGGSLSSAFQQLKESEKRREKCR